MTKHSKTSNHSALLFIRQHFKFLDVPDTVYPNYYLYNHKLDVPKNYNKINLPEHEKLVFASENQHYK